MGRLRFASQLMEYATGLLFGLIGRWMSKTLSLSPQDLVKIHRYWKQGVKLLNKPVAVSNCASSEACGICSATIEATFDPSNDELVVEPRFSITKGTSQF